MSGLRPPELVRVKSGAFLMGATDDDRFASVLERPRHRVEVASAFRIGSTPVTRAQWSAYADAAGGVFRPAPAACAEPSPAWPVMGVSRVDAEGYLAWLSAETGEAFRLPTEAQWEYAARAGAAGAFHAGDDLTPADANYLYDERARRVGPGHPTPVGAYPPNAWGLFDTLGSVAEWVADDWHPGYEGAPADGSARVEEERSGLGVIRGGSWGLLPRLCRCAYRDALAPDARVDDVGFRVACPA